MKLTSSDLVGSEVEARFVLNAYGCDGGNLSPALAWSDPPAGTRSFAVGVFDPDAPGSGWWHWLAYDIPSDVHALATGAGEASGAGLPLPARQGRNDFGSPGYGGPCPPRGAGPHRYVFSVYALDAEWLDADPAGADSAIAPRLRAHVLAQASLTLTYARP